MQLPIQRGRRRLLAAAALAALSPLARAQAYPVRPVRIVVPNAAGGAADITARTVGRSWPPHWARAW